MCPGEWADVDPQVTSTSTYTYTQTRTYTCTCAGRADVDPCAADDEEIPGDAHLGTYTHTCIRRHVHVAGGEELKRDFVVAEGVELKPELLEKLRIFFDKMDTNKDGEVDLWEFCVVCT